MWYLLRVIKWKWMRWDVRVECMEKTEMSTLAVLSLVLLDVLCVWSMAKNKSPLMLVDGSMLRTHGLDYFSQTWKQETTWENFS